MARTPAARARLSRSRNNGPGVVILVVVVVLTVAIPSGPEHRFQIGDHLGADR